MDDRHVWYPDPEAEAVALEGFDPEKVSYRAMMKACGLLAAGEIEDSKIQAAAERLTQEELEEDLARQEFIDYMEKDLPMPDTLGYKSKNSLG